MCYHLFIIVVSLSCIICFISLSCVHRLINVLSLIYLVDLRVGRLRKQMLLTQNLSQLATVTPDQAFGMAPQAFSVSCKHSELYADTVTSTRSDLRLIHLLLSTQYETESKETQKD